jgi:hypothetical protein
MNYDASMVKYLFLNSLFLRLFPAIPVETMRIVALMNLCPPFGRSAFSDTLSRSLFSCLNTPTLAGSRPGNYSSFRESPVSDAQQVVGPMTGLHGTSIERDARAAFTLWRYPSPRSLSSGGEVRKSLSSLVTDASPFTGTLAASKGLDAWQGVKDVVDSDVLKPLYCRKLVLLGKKLLSFVLILFSTLSHFVGSLQRLVWIAAGPKGRIGNDHLPEDSSQFPCHSGSSFSFDPGSFDKSLITDVEVGIEFGHLESRFTQSPSQRIGTGFGDLAGVFLPVGDVSSFGQSGPAGDGVGFLKTVEITELSEDNEPQDITDPLGAGEDSQGSLHLRVCFDNTSDLAQNGVSLPLNRVDSFDVLPEKLSFDGVEFFSVSQEPSLQRSGRDVFGSSGVGLEQFPAGHDFDLGRFPCDAVPLSGIHSQISDFQWRDIRDREVLTFHNVCDLGCGDLVGIGHSRPQLAQIQGVEEMDFVSQGLEEIPEPVIGSHGFDSDTEWLGQGLDELDDGSFAVVGDRYLFDRIGIGVGNGIGRRSGMQVNT